MKKKKLRSLLCAILKKEANRDARGNVIARVPGIGKSLLLSAHMDTVEPGRGIKPQITEDGYITSDGTTILGADNKLSLACMLYMVDVIKNVAH